MNIFVCYHNNIILKRYCYMKYIIISVVVAAAGGLIYFLMRGPSPSATETVPPETQAPAVSAEQPVQVAPVLPQASAPVAAVTELKIEDERIGTGAEAKSGLMVRVNYIGTLANGTKFDSSYDRGTPLAFPLGQHLVIPGWEQGLIGMKVGGKRKLTIPSSLAYGTAGKGPIPPNATLIFEIELLAVE